jgi:ubiquinone/menaquinone biosynthesis C-methylase UbiE
MASIDFRHASFDAVTAIYSIIHVPRDEQPALLAAVRRWLKPCGYAFLVLGANDTLAGYEADWFGAPMLWSHFNAEQSLAMLLDAGFHVLLHDLVTDPLDPGGRHLFALCQAS